MSADLEFMPWTAVKDAKTALRIVQNAGMPSNAGILVDSLHFGRSNTTLCDVRAIPRELLHYAQICDATGGLDLTPEAMIHTARCERLFPGEGDIDLSGLFSTLPSEILISVEVVNFNREASKTPVEWAAECLAKSRPFVEFDKAIF